MDCKVFESSEGNVWKYVFTSEDVVAEAVLYRYKDFYDRTVICCSTQSGCPVGCKFCGTGNKFIRNLTADEIVYQIHHILEDKNIVDVNRRGRRFQIMFMSMGEPFLNCQNLKEAICVLHEMYPNAQLLVSTSAPLAIRRHLWDFITLCKEIDKVGLQFSVHESNDIDRKRLIPTPTLTPNAIGEIGESWASYVGRKPFFNYCVHEHNSTERNVAELLKSFAPNVWECTLSVICEKDSTMQNAINDKLDLIKSFSKKMADAGYSLRVFNPAGQDDIGGGCGQLWYFQEWLKRQSNKA
jgi:23S rRNA (adenine2503-C2)-methyltransferase